MKTFKDFLKRDLSHVFLNLDELAEKRTVQYDGEAYRDIPVVLTGPKEQSRQQLQSDHAQGLYLVTAVLHCARSDLGGTLPEKGQRIQISDPESAFFREYYVASSSCELGVLHLELEELDE